DPLGAELQKGVADGSRIEVGVARFDANDEAVARGALKRSGFENRMIEPGQPRYREHAEKSGGDRDQQHELKCSDCESRPAIIGTAADIERVVQRLVP